MALLDTLSPDDQALLLSLQQARTVPAGTLLFDQGDPADSALFVAHGSVAVQLFAPGMAQPVAVHRVGAGQLLGEPALVARTRRMRRAVAETDLRLGVIHRVDLASLLSAFHPGSMRILLALARQIAGRLQAAEEETGPVPDLATLDGVAPSELDPRPYLPAFPFFARFSADDLDALLGQGRLWDVARGTRLVARGQGGGRCLLVVRGAVGIRVDGERIGLVGPGRPVGELSPLTGRPATADLVMREAGTLLELDAAAFEALTTPTARVSYKFSTALAVGLTESLARTNRTDARRALGWG